MADWNIDGSLKTRSGGTGFVTYDEGAVLVGTSSGPTGLRKVSPSAAGSVLAYDGADVAWTDTPTIGGTLQLGGNLTQKAGFYLYPGSSSGLSDYQTTYYLSSHSVWGLFSNTGLCAASHYCNTGVFGFASDLDTYIWNYADNGIEVYTAGGGAVRVDGNRDFFPTTDNARLCGIPTNRWSAVYAVNGTIQTSDADLKDNLHDADLGKDFLLALRPRRWTWKARPAPPDAPPDARPAPIDARQHYGFAAHEVESALGNRSFGGLYRDDANKPTGLNYSAFIAPLVSGFQDHEARLLALERRA